MTDKPGKPEKPQADKTKELVTNETSPPTTSEEALDRHLAEWGGSGGRLLAFNGLTGIHRTLDDNVEMPAGTEFAALLHETRRGYIKFNIGEPPTVRMVRIDENADIPERETLGDLDRTKWPLGLNATRKTPGNYSTSFQWHAATPVRSSSPISPAAPWR
jgi:hypothetical protein